MRRTFRLTLGACLLSSILISSSCRDRPKSAVTVVNGESIPQLRPADTVQGRPEERLAIRSTYDAAITALRKNSDDPGPYLKLAEAYILQSRISGNSAYYQAAVLQVLNKLIGSETSTADQRFMAFIYKSNVLFGMNRFHEALTAADEGLKIGTGNAGIWGTAVDANAELGHYDAAREAAERMMALRPDLRSYARVSYLRELRGDMPGAIETMAMAMESGVPGLEPTEWARVQLGDLCLNSGRQDSARIVYNAALEFRPGYAPAHAGLARLATVRRDYPTAIRQMDSAVRGIDDPLYLAQLASIHQVAGNGARAADAVQAALKTIHDEEREIPEGMEPKPNYAREYAIVYRAARNYPKALEYASLDHQLRPDNVPASALLAWLLYLNGDTRAAVPLIEKSLAGGWKNPELLDQAAFIYRAAGNAPKAESLRLEARRLSPQPDPVIEAEARK
jgi:tetratricopeptide (TPR) repeat protein